tara:strand:+ start:211886 stop:212551 length:666 start_codon:yes stop_codon:yes gene_type:complete
MLVQEFQELKKNYEQKSQKINGMNLEEMQTVWSEMSDQLENQKKLTNKLIMEMTREKYRTKIDKIFNYEFIGAIICFIAAIFLIVNFQKLDTWHLMACGIFVISYLFIIPLLVLNSIKKMRRINLLKNSYKQTLIAYVKSRNHFLFMQRLGIFSNFLLLLVSLPVIVKFSDNVDILSTQSTNWYWYLLILILFLILFSRWGYKGYKSMTTSAENILRELED